MKIHPSFELNFSFYGLVFSLFVHLGAIIAVLYVPLWWLIKIILLIIIAASFVIFLRQHVYRNARSAIIKLTPTYDTTWLLTNTVQNSIRAVLRGNSVSSLYCILLNFKAVDSKKYFSVIILPDALSRENFRQLKIAIKAQRVKD